jgi:hypothetical protein
MKPENVTVGHLKVGPFDLCIQRPVFQDQPEDTINYFEVFVTRQEDLTFYVDPKELEGFMFFGNFSTFERKLSEEDVVEFNAHVNAKSLIHPTHLMSRQSIVKLMDVLQIHAKKLKKNK